MHRNNTFQGKKPEKHKFSGKRTMLAMNLLQSNTVAMAMAPSDPIQLSCRLSVVSTWFGCISGKLVRAHRQFDRRQNNAQQELKVGQNFAQVYGASIYIYIRALCGYHKRC